MSGNCTTTYSQVNQNAIPECDDVILNARQFTIVGLRQKDAVLTLSVPRT